ncbi:hypothetical protein [Rhizobium phage RHEph15]|uniref:Uncharacterized protein n=2 Tax=Tepoztlanvirus TaxID=3424906 RepID=A0A7S5QYG0_9CAUD|nr:hypothetical protein EVB35_031 [Rhizobium phage RHph_TM34]QIG68308.1 hypothetical protein EVB57_031 [Rhizobium phage RHph_Y1_20]QIG69977.1 hypothetical protein EVB84_033 [Rhizobium phage RHph_Y48]QIG70029.1 hypothetical protein EVB85_033 [Rhizobium phage RHph_Y86]QIG70081.1 hypothetical protein EVB86_033 [Rhizobium phage RHph_Y2_7]QXV74292.1 hypothetical protein [Rhizobium phage RHEph15]QXV74986.1 hypothetical protein [Rhizobium phage RHEph27]
MCFNKQKSQPAVLPAATPVAQPVSASANVRSAVKDNRDSNADLRSDATTNTPVTNAPANTGDISLGAKKKRKGVIGLDL